MYNGIAMWHFTVDLENWKKMIWHFKQGKWKYIIIYI